MKKTQCSDRKQKWILPDVRLDQIEIHKTLEKLILRIRERFPASGLLKTANRLAEISCETSSIIEWIFKPHYLFRIFIILVMIGSCLLFVFSVSQLEIDFRAITISDLVQMIDSGTNWVLVIGAGIFFLINYETRMKRKRVIRRLNILIGFAHIIDAHQLTKDPDRFLTLKIETANSPKQEYTPYLLGRYLDYCTELLALIAKIGFIYVQDFNDPVANEANNDLEKLTSGISRKIWQKIVILKNQN